jgi:hypothetical protein
MVKRGVFCAVRTEVLNITWSIPGVVLFFETDVDIFSVCCEIVLKVLPNK